MWYESAAEHLAGLGDTTKHKDIWSNSQCQNMGRFVQRDWGDATDTTVWSFAYFFYSFRVTGAYGVAHICSYSIDDGEDSREWRGKLRRTGRVILR